MSEPCCPNGVDDGGVIRYCEKPPGHTGDHLSVVVFPGEIISHCEVLWPNDRPHAPVGPCKECGDADDHFGQAHNKAYRPWTENDQRGRHAAN